MFKRGVAIFLLCMLMLSNFSGLLMYGAFELNRDYISSVLCENKNRPEKQCQGKCYLAKKIKQAEEKERKQQQESQKKGMQDFVVLKTSELAPDRSDELAKSSPGEIFCKLLYRTDDVLHPPPSNS